MYQIIIMVYLISGLTVYYKYLNLAHFFPWQAEKNFKKQQRISTTVENPILHIIRSLYFPLSSKDPGLSDFY